MPKLMHKLAERAAGEWFAVKTDLEVPELYIFDIVGKNFFDEGVGAKDFVSALKEIKADAFRLFINSPGGNVFEGFAIYNAIKNHKARVEVRIEGLAASIASVIAMAGDEIVMAENSFMMIHDPWVCACGDAKELRKEAANLDRLSDSIAGVYASRSAGDLTLIKNWMARETWFTAAEAVEAGIATGIDESKKAAACAFDLSVFNAVPNSLARVADSGLAAPGSSEPVDMSGLIDLIARNTRIFKGEK